MKKYTGEMKGNVEGEANRQREEEGRGGRKRMMD